MIFRFILTAALVWAASTACLAAAPAEAQRMNVLFIAADDLRPNLRSYGDPIAKTPNLDRLAKRGVQFNRAYCQQALCNPSRASLLTGRRPDTLKIWDLPTHFRRVDPAIVTLPEHFKNHGYFTQNIGKIFHNWRQEIEGDPQSWSVPAVMHYATHGADVAVLDGGTAPPPSESTTLKTERRDVPDEAYFDGRLASLTVKALRERAAAGGPFFLAVGFWKPHLPFNPPKKYWDMYRRDEIPMPPNPEWPQGAPEIAGHNGRELLGDKGRTLSAEEIRELRHGYYAGISYLDAQVGKLLDELDRLKLTEQTVIVFWSDHGFHLGEHALWCKTSNFELDARVPLIIAPGKAIQAARGSASDSLAELLDIYPTLVDLCGLPRPGGLEGTSLIPILRNPRAMVKQAAFTQHPRPAYYKDQPEAMGYSIRNERYRYTEWRDWKSGRMIAAELYDHAADPRETKNLASERADLAAQLRRLIPEMRR